VSDVLFLCAGPMNKQQSIDFQHYFATLKDPRIDRHKQHPLSDILFVTLCGVICGAESWRDIEDYAHEQEGFLRRYIELENGIPSKSTLARVFSLLDPEGFKQCFIAWVQALHDVLDEVVAIDGKTLRHSFDTARKKPAIHMVSAFATQARLVLGQIKTEEKSNEITAIPALLDLLSLKGAIVTIDAMGCQTAIAEKIVAKEADYVLALKGNQSTLFDDVKTFLEVESAKPAAQSACDFSEDIDCGHGRIEIRRAWVSDQIDWLESRGAWAGLQSIGMLESERIQGDQSTLERRFYISTLPPQAALMLKVTRSHWAIENTLHWTLDMTFREDHSRVRGRRAAENMAIVRHMALNLLHSAKKHFKKDMSISRLRKRAGWGGDTLHTILMQSPI
jgi:predicted transposase YbfD/YdcC